MSDDHAVVIRGYRSEDLDAARALWVELTEWHRHIYASPHIGGDDPGRQFDAHLERVGPERIWVAEAGGQLVGLAGLILEDGEAELEPVVVRESHRGSGTGRALVDAVVHAAQRAGANRLGVRPVARNRRAIQFFHGLGFDVLGHLQLSLDFRPEEDLWRAGERLADRSFKV